MGRVLLFAAAADKLTPARARPCACVKKSSLSAQPPPFVELMKTYSVSAISAYSEFWPRVRTRVTRPLRTVFVTSLSLVLHFIKYIVTASITNGNCNASNNSLLCAADPTLLQSLRRVFYLSVWSYTLAYSLTVAPNKTIRNLWKIKTSNSSSDSCCNV